MLGAKGGLDIDETRAALPRVAEVPFDSDYKFMATFHEMTADDGRPVVRCYVKGAPDVLIARATTIRHPDGTLVPITDDNRHLALEANDQIANAGERVMVVAQRDFEPGVVQAGRRPDRARPGPHAAGDGRHRRPAAAGGQGRDRRVPRRRHPGPDDHRRPRDDGRRDRRRARHRGPGDHRHRVRRDERRAAAAPSSTRSASSPGSRPRTRSAWSGCSRRRATSSR